MKTIIKSQLMRTDEGYQFLQLHASGLTPRESQALLLRASGASYKDCAEQMNCSIAAVKARISNLFYKLNAANTPELISNAFISGHLRALSFIAVVLLCTSTLSIAEGKTGINKLRTYRIRHEMRAA